MQHAVAVEVEDTFTVNTINNTAHAAMTAKATAHGSTSHNRATATALLIEGTVPTITNSGLIKAVANARNLDNAVGSTGATGFASAHAVGIRYDGVNNQSAVTNSGKIAATAIAQASGDLTDAHATAKASAVGMVQTATGKGTGPAAVSVGNTGLISAFGNAVATGVSGQNAHATATAAGLIQEVANATLGAAFVSNPAGAIMSVVALAHAHATGSGNATAKANALGLQQTISAAKGIATVVNAGKIEAFASAVASSTGHNANAHAGGAGVVQDVVAVTSKGGHGLSATATVKNSGDIEGFAIANAKAFDIARATASGVGVDQLVVNVGNAIFSKTGSGVASAVVVNSGLIEGFAKAQAGGVTHLSSASSAHARASAAGVLQDAVRNANSFLTVTNSGQILATAYALAVASSSGRAHATARAVGVEQVANSSTVQSVATVTNSANGLIQALAVVHATASSVHASADAVGVAQGLFNTPLARAIVSNTSANAKIIAQATAIDHGDPIANAGGVGQEEVNVEVGFETVTNHGLIKATAIAIGSDFSAVNAHASAYGVKQLGEGLGVFTALVTNSPTGVIAGSAYAKAVAFSSAHAGATSFGVRQSAFGVEVASFNVVNSGAIVGAAAAFANATGSATAYANAHGVFQKAEDVTTVIGAVTNTGLIQAFAKASAKASASDAQAFAQAFGVDQFAESFTAAEFTVANAGDITAQATAYANSLHDFAGATAFAAGVFQEGAFSSGALKATVTNAATGVISGVAKATAVGDASARAYGVGVSQFAFFGGNSVNFTVANSGTISGQAAALAIGDAFAQATAFGVRQHGTEDGAGSFTALVTNSSSGVISGFANAVAKSGATASASAVGVGQTEFGFNSVSVTVKNAGKIDALAVAFASSKGGSAFADASAYGVFQGNVVGFGGAGAITASVTNSGDIGALAKASAVAASSATAYARAVGVSQHAIAFGSANLSVTNSANIVAEATAHAIAATGFASANAHALGVAQIGIDIGSMVAVVNNAAGGSIAGFAKAKASGVSATSASARASAIGVEQDVRGFGLATFTVNNSGLIQALATANAHASTEAEARATAIGVFQAGVDVGAITATVTNSPGGSILAGAKATAVAGSSAVARAFANGVAQIAEDVGAANFTVTNGGGIRAKATATANAHSFASASAVAVGIEQAFIGVGLPKATVDNSGSINVKANALAVGGTDASAFADARGIAVSAIDVPFLTVNITNSGNIHAVAHATASKATATNYAQATAVGIFAASTEVITGTIANHGIIHASAYAAGTSGFAHAVGIWDPSRFNNTHIINTGLISAYAQATGGAVAHATGILISGPEELLAAATPNAPAVPVTPDPNGTTFKTLITNDGGTIWAGQSQDGGATIQRGNAINTAGIKSLGITPAPNPVVIQLEGTTQPGHIFGDIIIQAHDEIDVLNGKTFFDGIINNPNKAADYNSLSTGYPFVGTVNIQPGGELVLCQEGWTKACDAGAKAWASAAQGGAAYDPANGANGPAYVFTNTFTNSGTLAYQLTPLSAPSNFTGVFTDPSFKTPATFIPGNYSQVFATTATLGGTLQIVFLPGLYNNTTTYSHIIEGKTVSGTFANVVDNSILLTPTPVYHDGSPGFVDLVVTRTPFNAVAGETQNEQRVGGGIENVFNQLPIGVDVFKGTNKFDQLVATLFTIDNAHTFGQALDQLSGAQFAQELQSVIWSTREINKTIAGRMDCMLDSVAVYGANGGGADAQGGGADMPVKAPPRPAPVYTGCFVPGHWTVWAQGHGSWNHDDGDSNAPGYKETQYGAYIGADYALTPNWFVGIAGGYFNSDMRFDQFGGINGGSIRYSGGQVAGYGGYDDRSWYGRAIVSAGFYTANSNRFISITGSPVDPTGKPDADVVSFYGEAGYHWYVAPTTTITPLLGLTVAHGWLNSFTEVDDGTGAGLNIHDSNGTSVATRLGARFSTTAWGVWRPELMVAWQHEFDDTTQTVNASFADAPGSNFSVLSSNTPRDWAVVEAGVTYFVNPNNKFSILYNGFLNQDYTSNSVVGRWTSKW
jgi:uncharacterized protein with beta-barrel porin domain